MQRVSDASLTGASLAESWAMLIGSSFGNHACSGKSPSHPQDIRAKLVALEVQKAKRYPVSDLIPVKKTLAHLMGEAT